MGMNFTWTTSPQKVNISKNTVSLGLPSVLITEVNIFQGVLPEVEFSDIIKLLSVMQSFVQCCISHPATSWAE